VGPVLHRPVGFCLECLHSGRRGCPPGAGNRGPQPSRNQAAAFTGVVRLRMRSAPARFEAEQGFEHDRSLNRSSAARPHGLPPIAYSPRRCRRRSAGSVSWRQSMGCRGGQAWLDPFRKSEPSCFHRAGLFDQGFRGRVGRGFHLVGGICRWGSAWEAGGRGSEIELLRGRGRQ